ARVAQDLAQRGSLTPADDETGFGGTVAREHAGVDEGLVVDEILGLTGLDAPVEHQELAVGQRLHDLGMLELRLQLGDRPLDGVRVAIEQLEQQVTSQRVQSTDPPLSDPSIYRTSPATNNSSLFTALSRRKNSRRDRLLLELYGRFSTIARKKRSSESFLTLLTTSTSSPTLAFTSTRARAAHFLLRATVGVDHGAFN